MDMVAGMLTMTSLDLVALAAVVLIGLPHGALDGAIAMHLGYANKILNFISFIVPVSYTHLTLPTRLPV